MAQVLVAPDLVIPVLRTQVLVARVLVIPVLVSMGQGFRILGLAIFLVLLIPFSEPQT